MPFLEYMACDLQTLADAPCGLQFSSARAQLEAEVLLLCYINESLGGESCADMSVILGLAQSSGVTCLSSGSIRARTAQIVCEGLNLDCSSLNCLSVQQLEIVRLFLTCGVLNADDTSYNCIDGECVDPGDGSGEFATLEECQALCSETNTISFSFWINMLSQPSPVGADIISNYDFDLWDDPGGSRQARIRLSAVCAGGGSSNYTFTVTVSQGVSSNTGSSSAVSMPVRTWHNVVVIYDGTTGFASVYVDTVLVGTSSGTPVILNSQPYGYFNATNAGHSVIDFLDSYVCLQDMTGIWVGHALTSSERSTLYNGGAGVNGPPWVGLTEPTAWWDFDASDRVDGTENFVDVVQGVEFDPGGSIVQLEGLIGFAVIKSGFARTIETEIVPELAYTP